MEKTLSQTIETIGVVETTPALIGNLSDADLVLVGGGCTEATPY